MLLIVERYGSPYPNLNVIARLVFELAYYDITIQHVSHFALRTQFLRTSNVRIINTR